MKITIEILSFLLILFSQIPMIAIAQPSGERPKVAPKASPKASKAVVDNGGCYIVNSAGKVINLNTLCGLNEVKKASSGIFQAKIKRRESGIPVIDVNFNNRNFEMILDTGASGTIITTDMAQALGVIPVAKTLVSTASANNVVMPLGYVKKIEVDGIVSNNVLVGIIPALRIGLLGHDFFGSYDVTVKRDIVEFRIPTN